MDSERERGQNGTSVPRYTEDNVAKSVNMDEKIGFSVSYLGPDALMVLFRGSPEALEVIEVIAGEYRKQGVKIKKRRVPNGTSVRKSPRR